MSLENYSVGAPKALAAERRLTNGQLWQNICGRFPFLPAPTEAIWVEALCRGSFRRKYADITSDRLAGLEHTISRVLNGRVPNLDQATIAEAHRLQGVISAIPFLLRIDPRLRGFHMVHLTAFE